MKQAFFVCGGALWRSGFLAFGLGGELLGVDDEALVAAFADESALIEGLDGEHQSATVDLDEFALAPYAHAHWGGGAVRYIDLGAYGALAWIEVGYDALVAGLLDEGYHHGGGEHAHQSAADMGSCFFFYDHLFAAAFDSGL